MSEPAMLATLAALAVDFSTLSLLAIGGANAVAPEMHRQAVEVHHWITASEFAELFAIAQAAPGPNVLIVTLIGWRVAGLAGAAVATVAMCAPSCVLTWYAAELWQRVSGARWRVSVQAGLGPVTVGLVLATGYLVSRAADASWAALAITAATVACLLTSRAHPLWLLGVAAVLGALGWVPA